MSGMSSLLEVNTLTSDEGESILPEVAELAEFHPDHLSSLEDIQEELDKLRAGEDVGIDDVMSMSTVDNVNVVDHEVTIVADQGNEDLPEPAKINQKENFNGNSVNTIIDESLGIGETITIRTPNVSESRLIEPVVSKSQGDLDQFKMSSPTKPSHQVSMSQLKAIRPLPDAFKGNKSIITMAQPKKNVLTKVIFTPNNHAAPDAPIIFGEAGGQTIRIVGQNKTIITNSPKTITLAQARDMGLLSPGKMQQLLPNHPKGMVKKGVMMGTNKAIAMMKSSPTKILPLPTTSQLHPIAPSPSINSLTPHKIFIRQTHSTIKSGAFPSTLLASSAGGTQQQILQLPVSQDNANHQIHQIQLPGKQVQYVRLVNSVSSSVTAAANSRPLEALAKPEPMLMSTSDVGTRPVPVALTANLSNVSNSPQIKIMPLAPVQTMASSNLQSVNSFERVLVSPGLSQLTSNPDSKSPSSNIVMVPAEYVKQFKPISVTQSPPSPPKPVTTSTTTGPSPPALLTKAKEFLSNREPIMTLTSTQSTQKMKPPPEPQNGMRPRKPCNCTKSQCLKLYCDCFANGEFCFQCNCNCCFNNLDHEEERQRAIKACLERNPNAFRPKIGKGYVGDERRHNKGCNCKRSGCLKNYCECYEAKIPCSKNCKCIGCRNVEEAKDSQNRHNEGSKPGQINSIKSKLSSTEIQEIAYKPHTFLTSQGPRQPFNLMTQEVVQATCQCLLAQVEGDKQLTEQVERLILEEFGRCLVEIIDCATRTTTVNNAT